MPRIRFVVDYGQYKAGQEFDVENMDLMKKHLEAERVEIVKGKPDKAVKSGETATLKEEHPPVKHKKEEE